MMTEIMNCEMCCCQTVCMDMVCFHMPWVPVWVKNSYIQAGSSSRNLFFYFLIYHTYLVGMISSGAVAVGMA